VTLRVLFSALMAAAAAYGSNYLTRGLLGRSTIVFVAPGLEESFKTAAALLTGAPVLPTHIAFGALEALYDIRSTGGRPVRRAPAGALRNLSGRVGAGLASLLGHALFGAVTATVYELSGSWPFGVGAAYLLHVGWNALVIGRVDTLK